MTDVLIDILTYWATIFDNGTIASNTGFTLVVMLVVAWLVVIVLHLTDPKPQIVRRGNGVRVKVLSKSD